MFLDETRFVRVFLYIYIFDDYGLVKNEFAARGRFVLLALPRNDCFSQNYLPTLQCGPGL